MKNNTNTKGQLAFYKTKLRALELGYTVSIPDYNTRYDLILDDNISLKRIQINIRG